jgi:hypothetical protein
VAENWVEHTGQFLPKGELEASSLSIIVCFNGADEKVRGCWVVMFLWWGRDRPAFATELRARERKDKLPWNKWIEASFRSAVLRDRLQR